MNNQQAQEILTPYLKPIYGFALKRCKTLQDAEDLSQEIALKAYRALLSKDDIADYRTFIWTIAHNQLSNYYRMTSKTVIGIPIEEAEPWLSAPCEEDDTEAIGRLQKEIAYLSKLQRRIVIAYYFEHRKQSEIAKMLKIPLGTVKWHLFEAKKELKRGFTMERKASDLKFHPIRFHAFGINGSVGTKDLYEFVRSSLAQNICYCVRNCAKSINEIADDLGVSPVYVESEIEPLVEYSFLRKEKDQYLLSFLISEPGIPLLLEHDKMYKRAAQLFANDLFDSLTQSGILDDKDIICNQTDGEISFTEGAKRDHNFLLWSLIPYIAAQSGEESAEHKISFEEVATHRPDGGYNIVHVDILPEGLEEELPDNYVFLQNWCGPMWNGNEKHVFWQVDSNWSDRIPPRERNFSQESEKVLSYYFWNEEDSLSKLDYAWLSERGYIKTAGDPEGHFKASWQIVILENKEIQKRLLDMGSKIKEKYKAEFDRIKASYVKAALESVPPHLKKLKEYELQFLFHCDGWFLLHCVHALLESGKLKPPTEGQRKALTTLLIK